MLTHRNDRIFVRYISSIRFSSSSKSSALFLYHRGDRITDVPAILIYYPILLHVHIYIIHFSILYVHIYIIQCDL